MRAFLKEVLGSCDGQFLRDSSRSKHRCSTEIINGKISFHILEDKQTVSVLLSFN